MVMNQTEGRSRVESERIKFTGAFVREVTARVERITDGMFKLGPVGSHPEHGTSYADARDQLTWYGPQGARQACAFYTSAAMRYLSLMGIEPNGDDGEFLLAVQVAYSRYGATAAEREDYGRWELRGAERAQELINAAEGDA
jgi:hypothetical protein